MTTASTQTGKSAAIQNVGEFTFYNRKDMFFVKFTKVY
jgi:hypothetical protein